MLKQLKYFQSVVRLNSFSEAAEENYISQSAVSQQIQALERELGFKLLERRNRSFRLTPAGKYFYQKSLVLTADYERMCNEASKIAKGNQASLRIGYLRCYTGSEFHQALELFSEKHPDVAVSIQYGNHEELYTAMRSEEVDMVLNDQRRAFSDEYVNLHLMTCESFVELSVRSPLAQLSKITPQELKNVPCILVASKGQKETEQDYYQTVVGIQSEILYAENLEEARLMVIGRKGFLPVEGRNPLPTMGGFYGQGSAGAWGNADPAKLLCLLEKRTNQCLCGGICEPAESAISKIKNGSNVAELLCAVLPRFRISFSYRYRPKTKLIADRLFCTIRPRKRIANERGTEQ